MLQNRVPPRGSHGVHPASFHEGGSATTTAHKGVQYSSLVQRNIVWHEVLRVLVFFLIVAVIGVVIWVAVAYTQHDPPFTTNNGPAVNVSSSSSTGAFNHSSSSSYITSSHSSTSSSSNSSTGG